MRHRRGAPQKHMRPQEHGATTAMTEGRGRRETLLRMRARDPGSAVAMLEEGLWYRPPARCRSGAEGWLPAGVASALLSFLKKASFAFGAPCRFVPGLGWAERGAGLGGAPGRQLSFTQACQGLSGWAVNRVAGKAGLATIPNKCGMSGE